MWCGGGCEAEVVVGAEADDGAVAEVIADAEARGGWRRCALEVLRAELGQSREEAFLEGVGHGRE